MNSDYDSPNMELLEFDPEQMNYMEDKFFRGIACPNLIEIDDLNEEELSWKFSSNHVVYCCKTRTEISTSKKNIKSQHVNFSVYQTKNKGFIELFTVRMSSQIFAYFHHDARALFRLNNSTPTGFWAQTVDLFAEYREQIVAKIAAGMPMNFNGLLCINVFNTDSELEPYAPFPEGRPNSTLELMIEERTPFRSVRVYKRVNLQPIEDYNIINFPKLSHEAYFAIWNEVDASNLTSEKIMDASYNIDVVKKNTHTDNITHGSDEKKRKRILSHGAGSNTIKSNISFAADIKTAVDDVAEDENISRSLLVHELLSSDPRIKKKLRQLSKK